MPSYGMVFPVLAGKEGLVREVGQKLKTSRDEYQQSRQRGQVTFERAYLQKNPDGTSLVIAYLESKGTFGQAMQSLMTSDIPLDQYFLDKNKEATGIDFRAAPAGADPELVGEYVANNSSGRGKGLAFAAPLQPGKTEAARQFAREAYSTRASELAQSRTEKRLTRESVFLNQTPMGDIIVVYIEGADPVDGNRQFAASNSAYDRWFKDQCKQIFPPYVDFDQPVPANEEIFSSV